MSFSPVISIISLDPWFDWKAVQNILHGHSGSFLAHFWLIVLFSLYLSQLLPLPVDKVATPVAFFLEHSWARPLTKTMLQQQHCWHLFHFNGISMALIKKYIINTYEWAVLQHVWLIHLTSFLSTARKERRGREDFHHFLDNGNGTWLAHSWWTVGHFSGF